MRDLLLLGIIPRRLVSCSDLRLVHTKRTVINLPVIEDVITRKTGWTEQG
jgi:hypothetical protein